MNVPNFLTLLRFGLTALFIFFIMLPGLSAKLWATFVFVLATSSDFLDGYWARKYNLTTDFGKILDPIADKFLLLAAFYVFVHLSIMPMWMFVVIVVREVGLTLFRLIMVGRGACLAAETLGKCKTVVQMVTVSLVLIYLVIDAMENFSGREFIFHLFYWITPIMLWLTLFLTVISGLTFLWNNRKIKHA